jgi:hypothetical protein
MFRRRRKPSNEDMTGKDFLNAFARDVLDPIAKKWNEWLDWVASAMTYTTDCLGPHDDGTVPDKSEMDPVLEGMNEIIRVGELIPSADYLAEGARELIDAIRDFSEGYVAEDLDRMNAGWVVLRDVVGRPIQRFSNGRRRTSATSGGSLVAVRLKRSGTTASRTLLKECTSWSN